MRGHTEEMNKESFEHGMEKGTIQLQIKSFQNDLYTLR